MSAGYQITYPEGEISPTTPVVFLLGWGGSSAKVLSKYAAIYLRKHCITVSNPLMIIRLPNSPTKINRSKRIARALVEHNLKAHPVIVHCFSNTGYIQYVHLADCLMEQQTRIVGAVFDSCPGFYTPSSGANAFHEAMISNGVPKHVAWIVVTLAQIIFNILSYFLYSNNYVVEVFQKMNDKASRHAWPQLYLYSDSDSITPKSDIELTVERAEKSAPFVRGHNFVTSRHVTHLPAFRERYQLECEDFLDLCTKWAAGRPRTSRL